MISVDQHPLLNIAKNHPPLRDQAIILHLGLNHLRIIILHIALK